MQEQYDHTKIEQKWQKKWEEEDLHHIDDAKNDKENFYQLVEFVYPSGNLHVGHWYAFAVPDIFARYKRMSGYNVLYPIGFDAFGLPAENAAIKYGSDPKEWTYQQMDKMRAQLKTMGAMFPWEREIVSCDPAYYTWTQWMFLQFYKNDLAYRDTTKVNWCTSCSTVLANEQVVNGMCDRCDTKIEQQDQEQWMLKITKYADRLIDDLDRLDWPEDIKSAQRNWIGRSNGAEIEFPLNEYDSTIKVFTTRPDTLFGVTYMVVAPEYTLLTNLLQEENSPLANKKQVENYITQAQQKSNLQREKKSEKTGVELQGISAKNPTTGESLPIWVADYVLGHYGSGAVMAVPAHDERDYKFAQQYGLPVRQVVRPVLIDDNNPPQENKTNVPRQTVIALVQDKTNTQVLTLNWKHHPWRTFVIGGIEQNETQISAAQREIAEETGYTDVSYVGQIGGEMHTEYFAAHKDENRVSTTVGLLFQLNSDTQVSIAEEELEKHTPEWIPLDRAYETIHAETKYLLECLYENTHTYTGVGELINSGKFSGLESEEAQQKIVEYVNGNWQTTYQLQDWGISRQRYWGTPIPIVYDPEGTPHPVPEEELPWTLPDDVDHTPDGTPPLARSTDLQERTEQIFGEGWRPEVETMDTFVDSTWYFYRYLDNRNNMHFANEDKRKLWMPVDLYMGGAEHTTMHLLYARFWVKVLFDLGLVEYDEAFFRRRNRGLILGPDGNKMSKSKGNVIDPDEVVKQLGADTVRLYLAFIGPYGVTNQYPWDPNGVVGVRRFLERIWRLFEKIDFSYADEAVHEVELHKTIRGVTEDIEEFKFNTAISKMMSLVNLWEKTDSITINEYKVVLRLLAPFAPHITEELWREVIGESFSIHISDWPVYHSEKIKEDTITIGVQINGKTREEVVLAPNATEKEAKEAVYAIESVNRRLAKSEVKKFVYVPGKIINIVTD